MNWWKIYFWVLFILSLAIPFYLKDTERFNLGLILTIIFTIVSLGGVYSYVFKKKLLDMKYWQIFFWLSIAYNIVGFIPPEKIGILAELFPVTKGSTEPMPDLSYPGVMLAYAFLAVIYLLIVVPMMYAIYQLGYNKKLFSK